MKLRTIAAFAAALLLFMLPAHAQPLSSSPFSARSVASESVSYSLDDLVGTWYYHQIAVEHGGGAGNAEWGVLEVAPDGSATVNNTGPDLLPGSGTFTMTVSASGEVVIVDDTFRGMLSFDRSTIVASYSDNDEAGLVLLIRPGGSTQFSQADLVDTWRMHSLQAGSGWKGWKAMEGGIDETGSFSGTQLDSDSGSLSYSASAAIDPDGSMEIAEPGNSMVQNAGMAGSRLAFGWVMGVNDGMSDIGRFDIAIRTGGDFIAADLAGEWHWSKINTDGDAYWGSCIAQADGSISGEYYDPSDGTTTPYTGTMQVASSGEITFIDSQMGTIIGEGTLSLDRSLFVMTETLGTTKTMMIGTKHPIEVGASIDVTEVTMDWGNGFSFIENMDQTSEGTLCDLQALPVHPSNLQTPLSPPVGSTAAAGLVYGQYEDLHPPVYSSGKITLPATLTADGTDVDSRFMPELALDGWTWPSRTGDIAVRAAFEAPQGDLAPQVGNGVLSADVGFSVHDEMGWRSDVWISFGFATLYVPDGIGELGPGYYNRQPFISYGNYDAGIEDFSVVAADEYDPSYPAELKVVVTPGNLARYYAHFGPPETEWTLIGEQQVDWWPAAGTGAGGCGTGVEWGEVWYSPYVSSSLEYVHVDGPDEPEPVQIVTAELPDATQGRWYSQTLAATGGSDLYVWEVVDGQLPPGLSLDVISGQLSGYPWETGQYGFTVRATDPFTENNEDTQEYTLTVYPDLAQEIVGQWGFHSIAVSKTPGSARAVHGSFNFGSNGVCTVTRVQMDQTVTTSTFPYAVLPDGTVTANGQPMGTLSYDNKRILSIRSDPTQGVLTLLARLEEDAQPTQYDAEGTWAVHSYEVGPAWQGWRYTTGAVDEWGEFQGTRTLDDGSSSPYLAGFSIDDGVLTIQEMGTELPQHSVMSTSALTFGNIRGNTAVPGTGRFDIGIRTGGDFITEDLEGKWWFYGVSSTGDVFRIWADVDATGAFTGEAYGSWDQTTQSISGTMSVTPDGQITFTDSGGSNDGHCTLSMNRAFCAGVSGGEDPAMILGTKRIDAVSMQTDVTHVSMNWGNGFSLDDPLDSDTPGTPCGVEGLTVPAACFTHPTLDPGGIASALYAFDTGRHRCPPVYEPGRLTLTSTALPFGENIECEVTPGLALQGTPWIPQTQDMELRATFENLQGYLATPAGSGAASVCIGFEFQDNGRYIGDTMIFLNAVTGYLHRGYLSVPKGYYNRALIVNFGCWVDESDDDAEFLSLIDGHDLSEPVELKLTISTSGLSRAYLRFLPSEEWIALGEGNTSLWPGAEGWAAGCYSPNWPSGIQIVPFVSCDFCYEELNERMMIEPRDIPDAVLGVPYEQQFEEGDSWGNVEWSISGGSLPAGLTLSADGVLTGIPTQSGEFAFTVRVEDSREPPAAAERSYSLTVMAPVTLQDAKGLPDGTAVIVDDVAVTRRVSSGCYVQNRQRSAGLLLADYTGFLAEGSVVTLTGTMGTIDGERCIRGTAQVTGSTTVRPVGMAIRSLGGSDFAVDPDVPTSGQRGVEGGAGLNNIGLLVKTWGRVTQIDPSKQYFYIEDGSMIWDGTETAGVPNEGVRVSAHPLGLQPGDYVTLTGISSCFKTPNDRLLRVIKAAEMQVHFPAAPAFVLGTPADGAPTACLVIFSTVLGATDYTLYQSTDGVNYTPTADTHSMMFGYGTFQVAPPGNTYYRVKAVDAEDNESPFSETVYARVAEPGIRFQLSTPGMHQTGVPLEPQICWQPVVGAERVGVEIHDTASGDTIWGMLTGTAFGSCARYGQPGRVVTYVPADTTLSPGTNYWLHVYAIDSGNWSFASCEDWYFTTEGTGGNAPPPPPF